MSAASGRRRGRRTTRGLTGRTRTQPTRSLTRSSSDSVEILENDEPELVEPEVVLMRELNPDQGVCIDLTEDTDESIVDLTNVDTPVTLRREPVLSPRRSPRLPRLNRRERIPNTESVSDDDDDDDMDDLPELPPFACGSTSPSRPRDQSSSNAASVMSPPSKFTCPVCLDDDKQVRKEGKKLYSTTCGHLFCEDCIHHVLQTQKKCPTCRKALTQRQVHPIYL